MLLFPPASFVLVKLPAVMVIGKGEMVSGIVFAAVDSTDRGRAESGDSADD